ncbi:hypothetical protein BU24DRAFT_463468 [Aaosphaeria arxii CBS 175.79]|uniref:Uncharacterized protein n=1 Tax=Aaosphaeria arxii CBS 175.79 TaxID=1450172 RepID=A0A6A5XP76_9PLEO|nr:uncharacterized protein BU24DRAFT_463468 [Aaosphaeria arxii CBS 175.79]KAF2014706.1 hypothetical protein BU24DRAFT_463468 [Aaosphaeria arxii CBS 175.79]
MGRQPFLTRLALGRSPFEPSASISKSSEYVQIDPSQRNVPLEAREPSSNRYVQLFDERGNAINPRAHEHGRRLRQAQNDVLSAIGVVHRRRRPSEGLPGAYEHRIAQLDMEDSTGNTIALSSTLTENLCTWWIGSLRDRILTFRLESALPLYQVVPLLSQQPHSQLVYTGFAARLVSTISVQFSVYFVVMFRPLDRLVVKFKAASRTRRLVRRWKSTTRTMFRLFVEVFFYPLTYHAHLQRMGLVPARPLLPPLSAFVPFSAASPLRSPEIPSGSSPSIISSILRQVLLSPLLLVCLEHMLERRIYALVYEAIETGINRPTNPDLISADADAKERASELLGLRRRSPKWLRNVINKGLAAIGWAPASRTRTQSGNLYSSVQAYQDPDLQEVSRSRVVEDTNGAEHEHPNVPASNSTMQGRMHSDQQYGGATSTGSDLGNDLNDPTIRITSRDSIVEMEVRFPAQVLSTHTEIAEDFPLIAAQQSEVGVTREDSRTKKRHRVTQLSIEPAQMLGAICKAQIVAWTILPLKLVTLRSIAGHYLASNMGNGTSPSTMLQHHLPVASIGLTPFDVHTTWALLSRVVLCAGLEFVIDISLWGLQWIAVTTVGKKYFGWGTL